MNFSKSFFDDYLNFLTTLSQFDPETGEGIWSLYNKFRVIAFNYADKADKSPVDVKDIGNQLRDGMLLMAKSAYHVIRSSHLMVEKGRGPR